MDFVQVDLLYTGTGSRCCRGTVGRATHYDAAADVNHELIPHDMFVALIFKHCS